MRILIFALFFNKKDTWGCVNVYRISKNNIIVISFVKKQENIAEADT